MERQRKPIARKSSPRKLSARKVKALGGKVPFSTVTSPRTELRKSGAAKAKRAKRVKRNDAYYRSAEWRDVKKRTHEHDGYRCTRILVRVVSESPRVTEMVRCPIRGEIVNGKPTARGLVCDEISYGRRGDGTKGSDRHVPGLTVHTLCADCNRIVTVETRANHANGFQR